MILKIWVQHFEEHQDSSNANETQKDTQTVIITEKLEAVIKKLKNNKASGKDVIHACFLKKMSVY
jgi:hypothetical protein